MASRLVNQAYPEVCPARSTPRLFCNVTLHAWAGDLSSQPDKFHLLSRHNRCPRLITHNAKSAALILVHPVAHAGFGDVQHRSHHGDRLPRLDLPHVLQLEFRRALFLLAHLLFHNSCFIYTSAKNPTSGEQPQVRRLNNPIASADKSSFANAATSRN